jgi:hypothetical protein
MMGIATLNPSYESYFLSIARRDQQDFVFSRFAAKEQSFFLHYTSANSGRKSRMEDGE